MSSLTISRVKYPLKINELLESHDIHTCLLPPNTTDRLQPLDIAVNKPAKDYMRQKFDEWYSEQITRQLNGRSEEEIDNFELEPINLSMVRMKEVSANWLVQMFTYLADNPQFLVNGFLKSGINAALDGCLEDDSMEDEVTSDNDSDSDDDDNSFIDDDDDWVSRVTSARAVLMLVKASVAGGGH